MACVADRVAEPEPEPVGTVPYSFGDSGIGTVFGIRFRVQVNKAKNPTLEADFCQFVLTICCVQSNK
jgi:hypothetical protein